MKGYIETLVFRRLRAREAPHHQPQTQARGLGRLAGLAGAVLAACLIHGTASAALLYDNSTTPLNAELNIGTAQVGNEVILNGTPASPPAQYIIDEFKFQYYGVNFPANAQMEVKFYANDGPLVGAAHAPGTVLFDSLPFGVLSTAGPGMTLDFTSDFGAGLTVPSDLTWTVQLFNVNGTTQHGGTVYYGPPTVGTGYNDYWYNDGTGWTLRSNAGVNAPFAAQFYGTPVPETSTWLAAGLLLVPLLWRCRKSVWSSNAV